MGVKRNIVDKATELHNNINIYHFSYYHKILSLEEILLSRTILLFVYLYMYIINNMFYVTCYVEGLKTISSELKDKLNLYLKLFIILYANDTVIMAESAADLQKTVGFL